MDNGYDIAREVTDSVMGEGTYADLNKGNPDPGVQRAIQRSSGTAKEPIEATIAVAVTIKLTAKGSTPDELISNAALRADDLVAEALANLPESMLTKYHPTVEGATALVNRQAIEEMFA